MKVSQFSLSFDALEAIPNLACLRGSAGPFLSLP